MLTNSVNNAPGCRANAQERVVPFKMYQETVDFIYTCKVLDDD